MSIGTGISVWWESFVSQTYNCSFSLITRLLRQVFSINVLCHPMHCESIWQTEIIRSLSFHNTLIVDTCLIYIYIVVCVRAGVSRDIVWQSLFVCLRFRNVAVQPKRMSTKFKKENVAIDSFNWKFFKAVPRHGRSPTNEANKRKMKETTYQKAVWQSLFFSAVSDAIETYLV